MLGKIKANLQLNMLTIGVNLSDIVVLTEWNSKKLFCVILVILKTINLINIKFNSIMNSRENKM